MNAFAIPSSWNTLKKKRRANCFPLSAKRVLGGPYLNTHASQMAAAVEYSLTLRKGTIDVRFENRSVMTSKNLLPRLDLASGSGIYADRLERLGRR